jgi:hypothetical protein
MLAVNFVRKQEYFEGLSVHQDVFEGAPHPDRKSGVEDRVKRKSSGCGIDADDRHGEVKVH